MDALNLSNYGMISYPVINYIANEYDICVFNRTEHDNTQTSLVIHVDDMIITASSESRVDDVIKQIETIYPGLTKHRGKVLNYIGMTFDFTKEGKVKTTMEGFVKDLSLRGARTCLAQHLHQKLHTYSLHLIHLINF